MNPLFEAALDVQGFIEDRGWRFCFIGGLAVIRWGEPRTTGDVDVTLLTGFGQEEAYIGPLLDRFAPRRDDAARFALANRVLLLQTREGIPVDIALAAFPYEEGVVERASPFDFAPQHRLITCSAEDLIVLKAFAGRPVDWIDVTGILRRRWKGLDTAFLLEQLEGLCRLREDLAPLERLKTLLETEA
ncbi:MAG: hypothetical protein WBD63_00860 [Phycisphaerae bacterium]|nr:hypothetical protein [Phycisphaerae bacterium]